MSSVDLSSFDGQPCVEGDVEGECGAPRGIRAFISASDHIKNTSINWETDIRQTSHDRSDGYGIAHTLALLCSPVKGLTEYLQTRNIDIRYQLKMMEILPVCCSAKAICVSVCLSLSLNMLSTK